jgi:hypothetical protein
MENARTGLRRPRVHLIILSGYGTIRTVSREDLIYLAALIDGEGSIMLGPMKRYDRQMEWPRPEVYIASTDKELLDWVKKTFGGTISNKKVYKEHHKPSYGWRITNRKAIELIKNVVPFMKIHKKIGRGLALIEMAELTKPNGKYTVEEIAKKQEEIRRFYLI